MSSFAPALELVARFRGDLERLAGAPERIGVAVSGGPDSLALLLLAHAAYPGRVEAATVDHCLRAESAAEAAFVARICADLGGPHAVLKVEVPDGRDGLQGEARRARYAALGEWAEERAIPTLLTAHHADDQAETLLMRLQRGSGLSGLAGIRAIRPAGPSLAVARPLLAWSREELAAIVAAAGLEAADDPSNRDTRFDRVTMRRFLERNPQFAARRLARAAAALAEAEEALAWQADRLFAERCSKAGDEWRIDPANLPREMKRRLLSRVIGMLSTAWKEGSDVEGLLQTLEGGGTATLSGIMAKGGRAWRLSPAPPRRPIGP